MTLDDLSAMSYSDLDALYRTGSVPEDFSVLDTKPKGRMLAVRGVSDTPASFLLNTFAKSRLFPWDGKTLASEKAGSGDGINRIKLGVNMNWFPFKTRIVKSVIDGEDTIYLDYEQPGNPKLITKIRDELREVAPGLFLGPAMWKTGEDTATTMLWFALDANQPRG